MHSGPFSSLCCDGVPLNQPSGGVGDVGRLIAESVSLICIILRDSVQPAAVTGKKRFIMVGSLFAKKHERGVLIIKPPRQRDGRHCCLTWFPRCLAHVTVGASNCLMHFYRGATSHHGPMRWFDSGGSPLRTVIAFSAHHTELSLNAQWGDRTTVIRVPWSRSQSVTWPRS